MIYELDELDHGIIKRLSEDGRVSFAELSKCLHVTEKTIRLRYKNLIDKEILNVVGIVNPIALGLKAGAIIQIKTKSQALQLVIEELKKIPPIRYITVTSGEFPLLVQITVRDQEKITEVLYAINAIDAVTEVNTIIQLDVHKNTFEYIR
ncbi:Lrp/AsnC family transcriptional regulator [Planomicrobium sp. CPCC 101079]|uniref:Lrp/AsnC family transcriptional regulator n=1 Tax=Planomicrobium sp. CPCC 101079 TaxID=2599618 RepID=UPI0011B6330B|nr:Lrp/AsnC family transcriptional regulator [Planomicrobium sp. CPCC 101079]TWT14560.1 Lrp/AsnC family transcriptional regulator [Planomicrobium sp. CPCC 101079]